MYHNSAINFLTLQKINGRFSLAKKLEVFEAILFIYVFLTHKRQSHKMVKYTRTIRQQFFDELFECV